MYKTGIVALLVLNYPCELMNHVYPVTVIHAARSVIHDVKSLINQYI